MGKGERSQLMGVMFFYLFVPAFISLPFWVGSLGETLWSVLWRFALSSALVSMGVYKLSRQWRGYDLRCIWLPIAIAVGTWLWMYFSKEWLWWPSFGITILVFGSLHGATRVFFKDWRKDRKRFSH